VSYRVRFTRTAEADLVRRYGFVLERDETDWALAGRALEAIKNAIRSLQLTPFSFRKASTNNSYLRELVIPFGASGYVALFEIDDEQTVANRRYAALSRSAQRLKGARLSAGLGVTLLPPISVIGCDMTIDRHRNRLTVVALGLLDIRAANIGGAWAKTE
jgi:hypothetical protein